jgi:hypothetical protein
MTIGKSPKTNFGTEHSKLESSHAMSNPGINTVNITTGNIIDIRTPGSPELKEGAGILVRISFDRDAFNKDGEGVWFPLKDDYQYLLTSVGNVEAVLKVKPRIFFYYHKSRFLEGYAELICDNKQEGSFRDYEKNRSGSICSSLNSVSFGTRRKG